MLIPYRCVYSYSVNKWNKSEKNLNNKSCKNIYIYIYLGIFSVDYFFRLLCDPTRVVNAVSFRWKYEPRPVLSAHSNKIDRCTQSCTCRPKIWLWSPTVGSHIANLNRVSSIRRWHRSVASTASIQPCSLDPKR